MYLWVDWGWWLAVQTVDVVFDLAGNHLVPAEEDVLNCLDANNLAGGSHQRWASQLFASSGEFGIDFRQAVESVGFFQLSHHVAEHAAGDLVLQYACVNN